MAQFIKVADVNKMVAEQDAAQFIYDGLCQGVESSALYVAAVNKYGLDAAKPANIRAVRVFYKSDSYKEMVAARERRAMENERRRAIEEWVSFIVISGLFMFWALALVNGW